MVSPTHQLEFIQTNFDLLGGGWAGGGSATNGEICVQILGKCSSHSGGDKGVLESFQLSDIMVASMFADDVVLLAS